MGRARVLADFGGFQQFWMMGDVLFRENTTLGFVLRHDIVGDTIEKLKLKRVVGPNDQETWIVGDAQKIYSNGTVTPHGAAHATAIASKADELAATGSYSHITLNRNLATATGRVGTSTKQPDIIAVRWDGKVEMYEYLSTTQTPEELLDGMEEAMGTLPLNFQTDVMEVLIVPQ